jgi:hypothetical protein
MVGTYAVWHPLRQPEKHALFERSGPAFLYSQHVGNGTPAAIFSIAKGALITKNVQHARIYLLAEFGHRLRSGLRCGRSHVPHRRLASWQGCFTPLRHPYGINFSLKPAPSNAPPLNSVSNEGQQVSL